MTKQRFGHLVPKYSFILNPYLDVRFSKCPKCEKQTQLRKFALLIHIYKFGLMSLGKTCRYCSHCELIIVHKDELEMSISSNLVVIAPQVKGNDYLVLGTVEKKVWRDGFQNHKSVNELREHSADFKEVLKIEYKLAGWYPSDKK